MGIDGFITAFSDAESRVSTAVTSFLDLFKAAFESNLDAINKIGVGIVAEIIEGITDKSTPKFEKDMARILLDGIV